MEEFFSNNFKYGTPDRIRTYDLLLRKQTLYPAELRVQMWILFKSEDSNNIHLEIKWASRFRDIHIIAYLIKNPRGML